MSALWITALALSLLHVSAVAAATMPRALPAGDHELEVKHDGRTRTALVHVPTQVDRNDEPLPVVLNFHGGGGNAEGHKRWSGLDRIADRERFIVVYPEGTGLFSRRLLTWNAGTCCGYARRQAVDDVGFVRALLAELAARAPVDHTRIYATGMSNGAMMSYRLAAEASDLVAAIAPVAGAMVLESLEPTRPVPVIHFHSVDDPRALFNGGLGPRFPFLTRTLHPSVEQTVQKWVQYDGCASEPVAGPTRHGQEGTGDASHTATKLVYAPCRGGAEVALWKLTGAGHVWPGAPPTYSELLLGEPSRVIDASEEMWQFFRRFSRPDAPPLRSGGTSSGPSSGGPSSGGPSS